MKLTSHIQSLLALTVACGLVAQTSFAKQGATDPIPGTSKGATNSGGGSGGGKNGGSSTPAPTPAPTPTPTPTPAPTPVTTATLTFSAAGLVNGVLPVCTGDYRIDPYYPTLLDMTLNVSVSSLNVPDGTLVYINVVGAGGTLYPYTSNAIIVVGGAGVCSEKVFVTLGASVAGVIVSDSLGNAIFAGN